MTTSDPQQAYVWVWLPRATEPVVAGRLEHRGATIDFRYGRSYLERPEAIPLYLPELPLRRGLIAPPLDLRIAGVIEDAGPDAWGQRVILNHLVGAGAPTADPADLGIMTYLLQSGSDRTGALDFQVDGATYRPRGGVPASLAKLATSAERVQAGVPLTPALDAALLHGSSIGGARPKAVLSDGDRQLIAKFAAADDTYPVVKGEFVAMELGRRAGLDVAVTELTAALGKDVLLSERFDREPGSSRRRQMVSALTILELDALAARHASYADLAEVVRARFTHARESLRELFARLTFNVLVGNTDDHARNHAAFWDGDMLTLTPAYDICPQPRSGGEATQGMLIGDGRDGFRFSQVAGCVERCRTFMLATHEARAIVDHQIEVIRTAWDPVCDLAQMTEVDRRFFWGRQFLNPYALYDY